MEKLLGGADALDAAAAAGKALVRRRELRRGSDLLRLALHYASSGGSLRATAAWGAAALEVALSDVALLGRLREAGDFLADVVGRLLAASARLGPDPSWGGPPIRVVDGTLLGGPGGGGPQLRLHGTYDPAAGRFVGLELTGARQGETLRRAALEPGAVAVADRNYARAGALRAVHDGGAFFLVRAGLHALRLLEPGTGRRLGAPDCAAALGGADAVELAAELAEAGPRAGAGPAPLALRLVVLRASEGQAARERARVERSRSKHGASPRPGTRELTGLVVLATDLDPRQWPAARVARLYRLRWQVELAFRTLKSDFRMRRCPAKDPGLARAWALANLAAALLADALADAARGAFPPSGRGGAPARPAPVARPGPRGRRAVPRPGPAGRARRPARAAPAARPARPAAAAG